MLTQRLLPQAIRWEKKIMLIKRVIHHHNIYQMPNRCWRIFMCIMFFPSADSTYIPYQWDMKFVDRSQPLQKALSLHFIIKTTEPTTLAFLYSHQLQCKHDRISMVTQNILSGAFVLMKNS
jgi:hypothetical protein